MRTGAAVYEDALAGIQPQLRALAACRSLAELRARPLYRQLEPLIEKALGEVETGGMARPAPARGRYRFIAWNIERGIALDGQIAALRADPYLREADVLLITEADLGMARSGNRAVAREMARELVMHYAFAPCYLNLSKGAGLECAAAGDNIVGLHGNAILSRYPLRSPRVIRLKNGIDKMARREKRIGCQNALAAEIDFPEGAVTAVAVHLDAHCTQRHRRRQMRDVLTALAPSGPAVLGGDWNTSTYNSSSAFRSILGFWLRVMMGVENVIRNHYMHPYRRFERGLFRDVERHGFDFRNCNRLGEETSSYHVADERATRNLGEWVPGWCFAFIRWALRNHGGRCPIKLDWFATRGVRPAEPTIVHGLGLSDHDPIGVDVWL